MNLLIIGGGVFLGERLLQGALEAGHAVTVFNRGHSRNWWPPGVKWIVGDRKEDVHLLLGRRWDAVIDTCGYRPQDVEATCAALFDSCDSYVFVSSVSAYASFTHTPIREEDPLASAVGVDNETVNAATYGPLKAECERTMVRIFGSRGIVVRPGLIVGPTDPTGRFSYWPWRLAGGGVLLRTAVRGSTDANGQREESSLEVDGSASRARADHVGGGGMTARTSARARTGSRAGRRRT